MRDETVYSGGTRSTQQGYNSTRETALLLRIVMGNALFLLNRTEGHEAIRAIYQERRTLSFPD